jgi:succinylarginine dihydrolase
MNKSKLYDEVNFDGLVGPSHNYAGLSQGNLASKKHQSSVSNPKAAALQGLEKMFSLHEKGFKQAFLPPHPRPYLPMAHSLGYKGSLEEVIKEIGRLDPLLLNNLYSASSMWVANAAMYSPSLDTKDHKVHFTIANLSSNLHRSIENDFSHHLFKLIFHDKAFFKVHKALPSGRFFADEGAANQTRLSKNYSSKGLEIFHFGHYSYQKESKEPKRYPSRQSFEACSYIAKKHRIGSELRLFLKQSPEAIDEGVFHNDVISVGNENVFFYHEKSFEDTEKSIKEITHACETNLDFSPYFYKVKEKEVSLKNAVSSYLFNSQILRMKDQSMLLLCPSECEEIPSVANYLKSLLKESGPIQKVEFFNLKESMKNGGGPACLRFRLILNETELNSLPKEVFINESSYKELENIIKKRYRDKVSLKDLQDPIFALECMETLKDIALITGFKDLYNFST